MQRVIIVLTIALCSTPLLAEEIYRWVDKKGTVNYTDRKPSQLSQKIKTIPAPASAQDQAPTEQMSAQAGRCAEFRKRLASYEGALSLSRTDGAGNTRVLSEEERNGVIEETRQQVEASCKE